MKYLNLIVIGLIGAAVIYWQMRAHETEYRFSAVSGPAAPSVLLQPVAADWHQYSRGGNSRLAILLTDKDSSWLGLAYGLKSIGVPFIITDDYRQALKHRVVLVYPELSGKLAPVALQALMEFPRDGGTLIVDQVTGGGMNDMFGFAQTEGATSVKELHFASGVPETADFTEPEEKTIHIGSDDSPAPAYAYTKAQFPPLAAYEDGRAAIVQKPQGAGNAYAIGPDIGSILMKGYNGRQDGISAAYINEYMPTADVLLRFIRNIYRQGEPGAVTLAAVPSGKPLAVLLTHDIDYTRSLVNALEYAAFERSRGITATYFMQVKYIRDWNDDVFFNAAGVEYLKKLLALDMEIGSHSVSHSRQFAKFPMGDGKESYPDYLPFVKDARTTENGTILGELRVSKFLIEHFLPGYRVESFRPGHLSDPFTLPEALTATGYKFSSSISTGDSLGHLPFRLNYSRGNGAQTPIFEFPLTIEDELSPPMLNRLPQAVELARKLKHDGGVCVILIHPDILGQKFEFEKGFVAAVGDSAWYGSMRQFGEWWAARDQVDVDVAGDEHTETVSLSAPVDLSGLTLTVPSNMTLVSTEPNSLHAMQSGDRIILGDIAGKIELVLKQGK